MRRRFCSLLGVVALVAGLGVTSATPVAAAPVGVDLKMVEGGGTLQIRGSDPYSIQNPTSIAGTEDDANGNLTNLTFDTPQVTFIREVAPPTAPLEATAKIDANFTQVAPGTGSVSSTGKVTINQTLTVDLHIEVTPKNSTTPVQIPGDCQASPVNLVLESTAPYDPDTKQVTVAAEDFTVPPVTFDSECDPLIGNAVNSELAGSGHSLSLLLKGDLVLPPDAPCDTTTELTVEPADASPIGEDVTFTAVVAPDASDLTDDPACEAVYTDQTVVGTTVDFLRGTSIVGSGVLDDTGTATFTTGSLPAGTHQLTARYRTSFPFYESTDTTEYRITIGPVVSTDLPAYVQIGEPTEFGLTVTNSQFAAPIDDARVDITIQAVGVTPKLERFDGTDWQEVTLATTTLFGIFLGSLPDFDLASGASLDEQLRLTGPAGSDPVEIKLTFEVVPTSSTIVPEPSPDSLGRGSTTVAFVEDERRVSALDFGGVFPGPVDAHTVRQGETITLPSGVVITPNVVAHRPTGYVELFVDGIPVPIVNWPGTLQGETLRLPLTDGGIGYLIAQLPPTIPSGVREVTLRYSGDQVFTPAQASFNITVLPARGTLYECYSPGAPAIRVRTQVTAQANLPDSVVPGELDLNHLDVVMTMDRSLYTNSSFFGLLNDNAPTAIGELGLEAIRFGLGDLGTATATGVTRSNTDLMFDFEYPSPNPDSVFAYDGESGTLDIQGDVGEVVPVVVSTIEMDMRTQAGGIPYPMVCAPVGDPAFIGDVRIAGVGLTVAPAGSVRAGESVLLTANTGNPSGAGLAEFLDGTDTIGVAPVSNGTASISTAALAVGDHTLKVRYYPQPTAPVLVSPEVALEVLPEFDCAAFVIPADGVHGAVVRLVYMELLNRCPDQAGYDYWLDQLKTGKATPTQFARTIAYTNEALDQVVIDAFQTTLERNPLPADKVFWRNYLRRSGRYQVLLAALSGSDEFYGLSGRTRAGLVTRVYNRILDRDPSPADIDYWVGELLSGKPRSTVMRTIAGLKEPLGVIVDDSFDEILDTAPNATERANAVTALQRNGDRSALYSQLIGDPRFSTRAIGYPNF